jgi:hypothetical protein
LYNSVLEGAKIHEVPIKFTDRRFGHSKMATGEYIQNVLKYVANARLNALKKGNFKKFLVVGGIGFVINTIVLEFGVHAFGFQPVVAYYWSRMCDII